MERSVLLVVLTCAVFGMAQAAAPDFGGPARLMPGEGSVPAMCRSATGAIEGGPGDGSAISPKDWCRDVLIDTGYVTDFSADWSLADGTMWLAEAPRQDSLVKIYRSTDHGMTWNYIWHFGTSPMNLIRRVGLVLGEGDSSYVYVFSWHPAENGNVAVVRLKPDLSYWDSYWVSAGSDSTTDFAVCRDYRSNYSLYCWTVVGDKGLTAPFLWSRDYGKTWNGTAWNNVLDPFLAPSSGPRINLACVNHQRNLVTAGYNYNYGDSNSWTYQAVNNETSQCCRPKIAAANTEPDSIATRWVMYSQDFHNSGDWDIRWAVRSHAWNDTWQRDGYFRGSSSYAEGIGDLKHYKSIGNPYVNASWISYDRATGETCNVGWGWAHADNPYGWTTTLPVNDSGTTVSYPLSWTQLVYPPGSPGSGSGLIFAGAGDCFDPHNLYFDAPWLTTGLTAHENRASRRLAIMPSVARGPVRIALPQGSLRVTVLDAAGRRVCALAARSGPIEWDARDNSGRRLAPDAYIVRCETSHGSMSGKLVIRD